MSASESTGNALRSDRMRQRWDRTAPIRWLLLLGLLGALLFQRNTQPITDAAHADTMVVAPKDRLLATDYPDLQSAIDALPNHSGEVYLPSGTYVINKTLNLTNSMGYGGGIKLTGAGRSTQLIANTPGQPVIDLTGSNECILQDLRIEYNGPVAGAPSIGVLMARTKTGASSQEHTLMNVTFDGSFSIADVYNIGSELDRFENCIFINKAPNAYNLVWSADNFDSVQSPYQGEVRQNISNTALWISHCSFYGWGQGGSNLKVLGNTANLVVRDSYMNPPTGGNAIYLGMSRWGGPVQDANFDSLRIEGENGSDLVRIQGRADRVTLRNSTLYYGHSPAINVDGGTMLTIQDNHFWNTKGGKHVIKVGNIYNSRITDNLYDFDNWSKDPGEAGGPVILEGNRFNFGTVQVASRDMVNCQELTGTLIDVVNNLTNTRQWWYGKQTAPATQFQ